MRIVTHGRFASLIVIVFLFLFGAVDGVRADDEDKFAEIISAHTSGVISKESNIRLLFTDDMIEQSDVGARVDDIFTFRPGIAGETKWNSRYELVFHPASSLTSGAAYNAVVDLDRILRLAGKESAEKKRGEFSFNFSVIKQDFEMNIGGFQAESPSDPVSQQLTGRIRTSDVEDDDVIEKIISANQENRETRITWFHDRNRRNHAFTIHDVKREANDSKLVLKWDANPIGIDNKGERRLTVSAKDRFELAAVNAVDDAQQYIEIRFTAPLQRGRSLDGLIRFSDSGLNRGAALKVDGNIVRLYPSRSLPEGRYEVRISKAVKSAAGGQLGEDLARTVQFERIKPGVRFAGGGVILPEKETLSIPFEAVNLHAVQVTAFEVYNKNIGRFLQANRLDGSSELKRVGRFIWKKTIPLNPTPGELGKWTRYSLDATSLFENHPNSLFRLYLSFNRGNSAYECSEAQRQIPPVKEPDFKNHEDLNRRESSNWDFYQSPGIENGWSRRNDPCHDAYYDMKYNHIATRSKNFMASNIGIIAKRGARGGLYVATTDIRTAKPLPSVGVTVYNYQDRILQKTLTDKEGFALLNLEETPFYLEARVRDRKGYLKLNKNSALPTSHFDVGGVKTENGVKGAIYGERGVWRPGDAIHLTFVLEDRRNTLPDNHPVSLELYNPRGQLTATAVPIKSVNHFHAFTLKTESSAPTGAWKALVKLGGLTFEKTLKIETVIPNRLKVNLDFGTEMLEKEKPLEGKLFSQWLHGAPASKLKADVSVLLRPHATTFSTYGDYTFTNPAKTFRGTRQEIFKGSLDEEGRAAFKAAIKVNDAAPGMLRAHFLSRVFEEGGAFSTDRIRLPFSPYSTYVGLKTPKGDEARGMLLTDRDHAIHIATVDAEGKPVSVEGIEIGLYKLSWKWWWDKSSESLANFTQALNTRRIVSGVVSTRDGAGEWRVRVNHPQWGRYLIYARVPGGHASGKIVYIDWPGWAGRARGEKGVGASRLTLGSDKDAHQVGETAEVHFPSAERGRALVTVENSSRVLQRRWVETEGETARIQIPVTAEMSPNAYIHVSLLQPHRDKKNDRPIRLYGILPVTVEDPSTRLAPALTAADELKPEQNVRIHVHENDGKEMTYTLAIVDEGLLGLTRYKTPALREWFYRREALGVDTWDMFDEVVGAYGGALERLLALGGDDSEDEKENEKSKKRFPPLVKFLGPFQLDAGARNTHDVDLPEYIGAVRIMVVAGDGNGAYGSADKSVPVRQPLMLLATAPRVLGPGETIRLPVSLFVMDPAITSVDVAFESNDMIQPLRGDRQTVAFSKPGDEMIFFFARVEQRIGRGALKFTARSGEHVASQEIHIDVRSPNPATYTLQAEELEPGSDWSAHISPHGMPGTNKVTLEISSIPPLNLESRLNYLIRYPHGCVEQTTSALFPQLYLPELTELNKEQQERVETHIKAGVQKLNKFQNPSGGFSYWPGGGAINHWGTTYAGHFLIEAKKEGYFVPDSMIEAFMEHQKAAANQWIAGSNRAELIQAYRLLTLALLKHPEMGAMNRLRESDNLDSVSKWQLAAAYKLSGQPEAFEHLVRDDPKQVKEYTELGATFGSGLRDKAMILYALSLTDKRGEGAGLAADISKALSRGENYGTQTTSYSLLALAGYYGAGASGAAAFQFRQAIGSGRAILIKSKAPILRRVLDHFPESGDRIAISNIHSTRLYANIISEGVPYSDAEVESQNGLSLTAAYHEMKDGKLAALADMGSVEQGKDIVVALDVTNTRSRKYENIALTHMVPSGWEIHNPRFDMGFDDASDFDYQDIRDDRIHTYFDLEPHETRVFRIHANASYAGRYYLPAISVEAMYDSKIHANIKGFWTEIGALQEDWGLGIED